MQIFACLPLSSCKVIVVRCRKLDLIWRLAHFRRLAIIFLDLFTLSIDFCTLEPNLALRLWRQQPVLYICGQRRPQTHAAMSPKECTDE